MATTSGMITFEKRDDIALLTLRNPPRNRLFDPVFVDPDILWNHLHEGDLRGVVLTGEGNHFCEGAAIDSNIPENLYLRMNEGKRILDIIEESPVPVVAAINGSCFGGGLELALACHLRVVGTSAMLGFPEAELGIMPGLAGTLRSVEECGFTRALPLLLSSEYLTGERAVELGLAHYVVPRQQVMDKAFELLRDMLGDKKVKVVNYIMQSVLAAKRLPRGEALELESRLVVELVEEQYKQREIPQPS